METTFYFWTAYSKLDCLTEKVGWYYGKTVRTVNFKKAGLVWKLIIRAFLDGIMYVCYTNGNSPTECLNIFYRQLSKPTSRSNIWKLSKY